MKNLEDVKIYDLVIVDAMNVASRSFHGMRKLSHEGRPTGMLLGIVRLVASLRGVCDGRIVFLWEGFNSKRKANYPFYKKSRAGRTKDSAFVGCLTAVKEAIDVMGCDQMSHAGLEADDLAGYMVDQSDEDEQVLLVSNDEDWYQYLMPDVVDIQRKDVVENYLEIELQKGFPPEKIGIYKMLKGDSSDDIPAAVPRLPEELAKALARDCDNIEDILEYYPGDAEPKWKKWDTILYESQSKMRTNADLIIYNPDWVNEGDIRVRRGKKDDKRLLEILEAHGMVSMIERLGLGGKDV